MLHPRPHRFGWTWPIGVIAVAGLGVLIHMSAVSLQTGGAPLLATPTPHAIAGSHNWAAEFPVHVQQVTEAFSHLTLSLPTPTEESQGAGAAHWVHRIYELTLPAPSEPGALQNMLDALRNAAPGVTVEVTQDATGAHAHIGVDGLLTHTLIFHWLGRRPRVAIVIQGLGDDLRIARTFVGIRAPLTFSVTPFRPFSKEIGELAALFQREVLLHLPVESENQEDAQTILRANAPRAQIIGTLDESLAAVPHAAGADTNMGSPLAADRERLQWIQERLKEKGLFFVDSRSTPGGDACDVAAIVAVACSGREVFLDEADDEQTVRTQLQQLMSTARTRGDVIAFGRPYARTAAAVEAVLPDFAAAGIDIVPVSTIVGSQSAPQR